MIEFTYSQARDASYPVQDMYRFHKIISFLFKLRKLLPSSLSLSQCFVSSFRICYNECTGGGRWEQVRNFI